MVKRLKRESDRGAALIMAAWIEEALSEFLRSYLVQDQKVIEDMLGRMKPLASFSATSRTCYLLGLIDRETLGNLETIREIRNDFAHSRGDLTFEDQSIRDRCASLNFRGPRNESRARRRHAQPAQTLTPRETFLLAGLLSTGYLIKRRSEISPVPSPDPATYATFLEAIVQRLEVQITAPDSTPAESAPHP